MKDILQNWNAYTGKTRLTESQIKKIKIKYPSLEQNGIIDFVLKQEDKIDITSTLREVKCFYQNSAGMLGDETIFKIIEKGIREQIDLFENVEEIEDEVEDEVGEEPKKEFDPFSHLKELPVEDQINEKEDCVLTFGTANAKLSTFGTTSFSLPAGYSCPFAAICKSKVPREGGPIKDYGDIRCFQSSIELARPTVRAARWRNFDLLKRLSADEVKDLVLKSLKHHEKKVRGIRILRIHDSGDFFSQQYFDGWLEAARIRWDIVFYFYSKSIPYIKNRLPLPENFRFIPSRGGTADAEIEDTFRQAIIVSNVEEAIEKNLNIDVNEFLAIFGEGDFALLLHGTQPKGKMIGDRKATSVARENSKIIKKMASGFNVPDEFIENLISKITNAAREDYERFLSSKNSSED